MSKRNQNGSQSGDKTTERQKGPVARDANPARYGAGSAPENQQGPGNDDPAPRDGAADTGVGSTTSGTDSSNSEKESRQRELTERRHNDPGSLTEDEVKALATLEQLGGVIDLRASSADVVRPQANPNPGDPTPAQTASEAHATGTPVLGAAGGMISDAESKALGEQNREMARELGIDLDKIPSIPETHGAADHGDRAVDRSAEFDQSLDRDLQIEGLHAGPGGRKYLVLNLSDDQEARGAAQIYGEAIRMLRPELSCDLLAITGDADSGAAQVDEQTTMAPSEPQDVIAVPNPDQRTVGMYPKYRVSRMDGTDKVGGKHHGAEYFVIDMADPFAQAALGAYADACKASYPLLAADLYRRAGINVGRR